jgi:hypothetical protein
MRTTVLADTSFKGRAISVARPDSEEMNQLCCLSEAEKAVISRQQR